MVCLLKDAIVEAETAETPARFSRSVGAAKTMARKESAKSGEKRTERERILNSEI